MEIVIYQIIIGAIIIVATLLKGQIGLNCAAVAAVAWTFLHVFAPWLMLIQFAVIAVAYMVATGIVSEE